MDSATQPFSPAYRDSVSSTVLEWASADNRVVAGAVVGSMASGAGDRWSDLDLSFAVDNHVPIGDVLESWAARLKAEFSATELFDLPAGQSIYRVFLLPGCLQFDLSFSPSDHFGAIGPQFKLLFGTAVEKPHFPTPRATDLFGYAVHHLLRARVCIERDRVLQAEYCVSSARDYTLHLACQQRRLPASHGRGFDHLPSSVRDQISSTLVRSLDRDSLLSALSAIVGLLLEQSSAIPGFFDKVEPQLRTLTASWNT